MTNSNMIDQFQGEDGKRRLISALRDQSIVRDNEEIATRIATIASLRQFEAGDSLAIQGEPGGEIFFVVCGAISIIVNGRELTQRVAGCHVGEMATIDPTARRAATLLAAEQSVVAIVSEPEFSKLAEDFPNLWRRMALDLSRRLHERNRFVKKPNEVPEVFIGCSVERLEIARQIQDGLQHDAVVTVWTDGVFQATSTAVEDLLAQVGRSDFAVLIVGEEDTVISREHESPAPRDNVIFELGLFMGELGRARSFFVKEHGSNTKIPSDLLGLQPVEYGSGEPRTLTSRIAPVCNIIRRRVKELGSV